MEKVFNIGFSKSGTTSFERAMEILGYNTYRGNYRLKHNDYLLSLWVNQDFDEIKRMTRYWDAFADAPWGGTTLYRQLIEWYPDARFVYTVRDPDDWFNSLYKMLTRFDDNPSTALETYHANDRYGFVYFLKYNFGIETLDNCREKVMDYYKNHYHDALQYLDSKGVQCLVFDPINGDSWEQICKFLDRPIPEEEYPHANKYAPIVLESKQDAGSKQEKHSKAKKKKKIFRRIRSSVAGFFN